MPRGDKDKYTNKQKRGSLLPGKEQYFDSRGIFSVRNDICV